MLMSETGAFSLSAADSSPSLLGHFPSGQLGVRARSCIIHLKCFGGYQSDAASGWSLLEPQKLGLRVP